MNNRLGKDSSPRTFQYFSAIAFDTLALFSLLLLASVVLFSLNQFEPINGFNPLFIFYLLGVCFFYFGWSWMHGGQTVGMKLWRIHLADDQHHQPSWTQVTLRFFACLLSLLTFGIGFLWYYFDKNRHSWPDHFSGTQLYFD